MLILFLWTISFALAGLATLVCGIVCLFIKDKNRAIAIDTLLGVATLTVALGLSANFIPKEILTSAGSGNTTDLEYHRQADLWNVPLKNSRFYEQINPAIRPIAFLDGYRSFESIRKMSITAFKALLKEHPHDQALNARMAILVHSEGADASKYLETVKGGKQDKLISLLKRSYQTPPAQIDEGEAKKIVEDSLPPGWFRDEALKSALGASSETVKQEELAYQESFNDWQRNYAFFQMTRLLICVVGFLP